MHPALPARAFETGVGEHFADDESARLVGAHLAGKRRDRSQNTDQQRDATHHKNTPTNTTPYEIRGMLFKTREMYMPFVAKS
jgi:hypothetical protein